MDRELDFIKIKYYKIFIICRNIYKFSIEYKRGE